jgi:hypothetical protein
MIQFGLLVKIYRFCWILPFISTLIAASGRAYKEFGCFLPKGAGIFPNENRLNLRDSRHTSWYVGQITQSQPEWEL